MPQQRKRKGAKAAGLRYERALAAALPFALHGAWFEFHDASGRGYCQPDFIARFAFTSRVVVLEAKMSDLEAARWQLRGLYEPIIAAALKTEVAGIAVVRHLSGLKELQCKAQVHETLSAAVRGAIEQPLMLSVLHWRERTPVGMVGLLPQPVIPNARVAFAA